MRSGLGRRVFWYVVMNVWRSIVALSSQAVRSWKQYVLTKTSVPTSQATQSRNSEDYNFESSYSAFSMHCITITKQLNTR
jgi:hypothetical protein